MRTDVIRALAPAFSPDDPARPDASLVIPDAVLGDLPYSGTFAALPWAWVGRHTGEGGSLLVGLESVPRTGRVVTVSGLSLLQRTPDDGVHLHRYVDWLGVHQQLGVAVGGRAVPLG